MKQQVVQSDELQVYQFLRGRMSFTREQGKAFYNAKKGFEGEKKFAKLVANHLSNEYIPLYGLLLENNGTLYQIDCLLIFQNEIICIEVKNNKGEFVLRKDHLYSYTSEKKYRNPLHQLQRSEINLQELLSMFGEEDNRLRSYVVFVDQEFTLFHAERNPTIILPTQINAFFKKLNQIHGKICTRQQQLSEKIVALHVPKSPYTRLPDYKFEQMRKGVLCRDCRGLMQLNKRKLLCHYCSYTEFIDSGVLRSVIEFNALFPKLKIISGIIHEWCSGVVPRRTLFRILSHYLKPVSKARGSHYIFY